MKLHWRHLWRAVAVTNGTYVFGGGHGTTVLQQCERCGKLQTTSLNGTWTLEQVREQ